MTMNMTLKQLGNKASRCLSPQFKQELSTEFLYTEIIALDIFSYFLGFYIDEKDQPS